MCKYILVYIVYLAICAYIKRDRTKIDAKFLCACLKERCNKIFARIISLIQQFQHCPSCRHLPAANFFTNLNLQTFWKFGFFLKHRRIKALHIKGLVIPTSLQLCLADLSCDTVLSMRSQLWNSSSIDGRFQISERQRISKRFFSNLPTELSSKILLG